MVRDRIKINKNETSLLPKCDILLDNLPLFKKDGFCWKYCYEINNRQILEALKTEDNNIHILLDNVIDQLEDGVDRNKLNMYETEKEKNIRKRLKKLKRILKNK